MCRLPLLLFIALSMVAVPAIADDRKPVQIKWDLDKTDPDAVEVAENMFAAMKNDLMKNKKYRNALGGDEEVLTVLIEFDDSGSFRWHQMNGFLIRDFKKPLQQTVKKWQVREVRRFLYGGLVTFEQACKDLGDGFILKLCDDTPEVKTDLPFAN